MNCLAICQYEFEALYAIAKDVAVIPELLNNCCRAFVI